MDFTGTIHKIFDTVHISETFKKRSFVIESTEEKESGTYTELISFEFIQDKVDLLDGFKVGNKVSLGFNLKGRKWTSPQGEDRYFNTLQSWMIKLLEGGELPKPEVPQAAPKVEMPNTESTEIPF